jgi:DNA-binding LytR/AlgR family response regulator
MLKYSCIIIEDEPLAAEILSDYIKQVPFLDLKAVCTDAIYGMEMLQQEKIDLIFLDIHLPKLKGLEFLETLKTPPNVIITTAYKEYALQGYELSVLDYLLKPVRFSRFLKAVNKLKQPGIVPAAATMTVVPQNASRNYIYFNVGKKRVKIYTDDILYVESIREYVKIITTGKTIITKFQLSEMEEMLPPSEFLRIHRSFLVSKHKVDAFSAIDVEINGKIVPIGRSYKELVLSALSG